MHRSTRLLRPILVALFVAALCVHTRGDRSTMLRAATPSAKPHILVWAWEEPEDLRTLDPERVGVAFLAERVFVGKQVTVVPRRQRILLPAGAWTEAVVRVEMAGADNAATRTATAEAILKAARLPAVRAVQVDFDATLSQREFYADVLRRVRAALPAGERLEMTALVSWCAVREGWLQTLPIDAAVPMEFRLGEHAGKWAVREPLCANDMGVSTDEPENRQAGFAAGTNLYVFAPRPFAATQLKLLNEGTIPTDAKGAR